MARMRRLSLLLYILAAVFVQGFIAISWKWHGVHEQMYSSIEYSMEISRMDRFSLLKYYLPKKTSFNALQARAFPKWPENLALPCTEPEPNWPLLRVQRSPADTGFLMVKEMKTGSSTAAGINLRIARNVARRNGQYKICRIRNDHATAERLQYGRRDKTRSFLWTVIRDPTERAVSQFYHFQVSRQKVEPTDENFIEWAKKERFLPFYYLRTLSMTIQPFASPNYDAVGAVNKIIGEYNFIGVTERMDESAVALQILLGLSTGDVLFLNAKNSGGYDDGVSPANCVYIVPSQITPGMKEFFRSEEWKRYVQADTWLHQVANASLDMTIDQVIGRERFDKALTRFRWAQQTVKSTCMNVVRFPCTSKGEKVAQPDCFWGDSGCGTGCIDRVVRELGL